MDLESPPPRFDELCFKIGLAVIQGQKVQFALAHYFAVFQIKQNKWSKDRAKASIEKHLSKPMGNVIKNIEDMTTIEPSILQRIKSFRDERNWLAHDFDRESTPFLRIGERIPEYIDRMDSIVHESVGVMQDLDCLGEQLCPVRPA